MLSDQLRTKQGPLARVWLASHWERKISKSQFLNTNLEKTIDAITANQQEEPLALRVSGQLLLGVVRIYSRKTKYLLEDCNEALVKIKLAFKKGDINMPDISHTISNANTITMQDKLTEFDILLPDLPFNANGPAEQGRDPILDSLGDMSFSQDITLSGQADFSFGNWESGRAGGVEAGRRDNEAGLADNGFDMDAIADPLKDMNLNDNNNNGIANDAVDFDFDLNDNIDYGQDYGDNMNEFDFPIDNDNADASLDTLMQVGIVEDDSMFDVDAIGSTTTEPVRRRKRLVVDKVTEIPSADLKRYAADVSSIIQKEKPVGSASKAKPAINLTQPSGDAVGSELEALFAGLSRKRRASGAIANANKEARVDDAFGAPTPGGPGLTSAFHFDDDNIDYGQDYNEDNVDFNRDAFNRFNNDNMDNDEALMTQNTQSFSNSARGTLEKLEKEFPSVVKFNDLAPGFSTKAEAARMFYDVLLLSTKDMIKVKQDRAYGEIQISAPTAVA
ncbi:ATP-dependent DNA helicase Snf21 [Mucor velutinosus]|uniref:ATP-dependent DNA helicase Snf21 n=1 Tax=Mucor velutinosus TaxID=708070 RepID=A0AAN7I488_9FUNG|nr:ATP-dependent DNA helicase Snf21 [Mucor velutinosus]